jgi:uncharacterized cupin superfamily protein
VSLAAGKTKQGDKEMPKIELGALPVRSRTTYPEPFARIVDGREWRSLGDEAGLTQFGVNLFRLRPGAASSARHWHEQEDEFVYMVEGELVLVEDEGETIVRPGDAAGFKAGVPNGHHLVNRSDRDAVFLAVGTRAQRECCHYSEIDLVHEQDGDRYRLTHKSGAPYGDWQRG